MTKKEIRKIYREKRMNLSVAEMDKLNDLLLMQFQKIPLSHIGLVHSFLSSEKHHEPDTSLILRFLEFRFPHIRIAVPKVTAEDNVLQHVILDEDTGLEKNIFGIEEPAGGQFVDPGDIDLVLVPLLAFDYEGFRVGFGKGYYDRFLNQCHKDVVKVGLSFFDPVSKIDDTDVYDIPLNYCCTPHKLYSWPV